MGVKSIAELDTKEERKIVASDALSRALLTLPPFWIKNIFIYILYIFYKTNTDSFLI